MTQRIYNIFNSSEGKSKLRLLCIFFVCFVLLCNFCTKRAIAATTYESNAVQTENVDFANSDNEISTSDPINVDSYTISPATNITKSSYVSTNQNIKKKECTTKNNAEIFSLNTIILNKHHVCADHEYDSVDNCFDKRQHHWYYHNLQ